MRVVLLQAKHKCRQSWGSGAIMGGALVSMLWALPAFAGCSDPPRQKVDWSGCPKTQLMLSNDDLSGGIFKRTVLSSTDFTNAKLAGAKLEEAEISFTRFEGADLTGGDLSKAVGWRANFKNAKLEKAELDGAQFSRANFAQAKLAGANLTKSELNRSDFTGADLTRADISKAELARVVFKNATLAGINADHANLARADLASVDLQDANMTGAYLYRTQVSGADLSRTKGLTQEQVTIACGSQQTKLPAGLTVPKTWPCADDD